MTASKEIILIRPESDVLSKQNLPNFIGISAASCGSSGLSMNLIIIPPGGHAEAHLHRGFETAIYVLEGRAVTRYGDKLENRIISEAGDFLYIPADIPHQPFNLSDSLPVKAIVARNDANEQESVELFHST